MINLRMLLIVCCLLVPATSIFAQSLEAFSDPISSRLMGSRGPSSKRGPLAVELQNDAVKSGHVGGESVTAQQPVDSELAVPLRKSFGEVSGWVAKAANLVPADKYSYRPSQSVRTFGQLIGHIADSYNYYCARATGQNTQWSDPIEKGVSDKATLIKKLQQSLETCNSAYGSSGQVGPLIDNVAHTSLHYGNIITYIRVLGLKPPSS